MLFLSVSAKLVPPAVPPTFGAETPPVPERRPMLRLLLLGSIIAQNRECSLLSGTGGPAVILSYGHGLQPVPQQLCDDAQTRIDHGLADFEHGDVGFVGARRF